MKTAVITANLGNFDPQAQYMPQTLEYDFYRYTDQNFPPRYNSLSPRLQARIAKLFGWQMAPRYDVYIWIDSSCALAEPDSVKWLIEQCGDADIAVFKHPDRTSAKEEAEFLISRIARNDEYIVSRYKNELLAEQMAELESNSAFEDTQLFASTILVYKNNPKVHTMMKEWWYHTSRYHSIDQLSLPYSLFVTGCSVKVIPDNYMDCRYIRHIRKPKDLAAWETELANKLTQNTSLDTQLEARISQLEQRISLLESQATTEQAEVVEQSESTATEIQEKPKPVEIREEMRLVETDGYKDELEFWKRWLAENGKYFASSRRLVRRLNSLLEGKTEVKIANLGAGAMNIIGDDYKGIAVEVVSSDLLADEYASLKRQLQLSQPSEVEKQDMEHLTYADASFDIVYCGNALDHCNDPRQALNEMLRICKPGGAIYLRHIAHEGKRHQYRGLHKWNIDIMDDGDCRFWSEKPGLEKLEFKLSDVHSGFENSLQDIPKGALITSVLRKR